MSDPVAEEDRPPTLAARTPGRSSVRNSNLVAAGILLSRITGLARERVIATYLGSGLANEAFRAALRIPNLLQNLLGEGVLSASFIPVYAGLLAEDRRREAQAVAGAVAGLLVALSGVLVLVGVVFARPLTAVLAAGFTGEKFELTVTLVRIVTPGIGFLVLSAWCLGVLNSHRSFFLPYVAPVLWNAAIVAALVTAGLAGLAQQPLAVALAWGTFAGGALQLAVQVPRVRRLAPGLRPSLRVGLPGVRQVLRAMGPVVAGRGVVQILGYVNLLLATLLAAGALASLAYAQIFYLLPISLFGMSVAAAELPELSGGTGDRVRFTARLEAGLSRIAFFVLPTMAVYVVLGDLVVGALLQSGRFDRLDTLQVWAVLAAYTPGLLANTSSRLLQSALYASGDTKTPALISTLRIVVAGALGAVLMLQLDQVRVTADGLVLVGDLPSFEIASEALRRAAESRYRLGAAGLALGAGLSAWLEYALLRRAVGRRIGPVRRPASRLVRIALATLPAVGAGAGVRALLGGLAPLPLGALGLGVTGAVYLGVAAALGLPEVTAVIARLRRPGR